MIFITFLGILICLFLSALFSGLNIGLFGLNRLRLEILTESGDKDAHTVLELRSDFHYLLTTLIWGNVSVNCLLTILSGSIFTGLIAFIFSTFLITLIGEIIPQAYFSKNALKIGAFFTPFIKFIQKLMYPVAKPSAILLDTWLGKENLKFFRESELKIMLQKHMFSFNSEISHLEGIGAVNFLNIDDILISEEGEIVDPQSIINLETKDSLPIFPEIKKDLNDSFLQKVQISDKKWIIITDSKKEPCLVIDSNSFIRDALYGNEPFKPYTHCHRPIIVTNPHTTLGQVIKNLTVYPEHSEDDVIDNDIILYWGENKRVITGSDLLGRLLRGIVIRESSKTSSI